MRNAGQKDLKNGIRLQDTPRAGLTATQDTGRLTPDHQKYQPDGAFAVTDGPGCSELSARATHCRIVGPAHLSNQSKIACLRLQLVPHWQTRPAKLPARWASIHLYHSTSYCKPLLGERAVRWDRSCRTCRCERQNCSSAERSRPLRRRSSISWPMLRASRHSAPELPPDSSCQRRIITIPAAPA